MLSELERLREENREAYADNKVLTKTNFDLEEENTDLKIEVAVLKERLQRYSSPKRSPKTYVIDIFKFPTIAAAITAAIAGMEKLLEHFKG